MNVIQLITDVYSIICVTVVTVALAAWALGLIKLESIK